MLTGDVAIEVLEDAHYAGRPVRRTVRADCHELHRRRALQRSGQVGHEHGSTLEHADKQHLPVGVVGVDSGGELGDLLPDLVGGDDDRLDVGVQHGHGGS
jgi:hypothetical protein